MGTNSDRSSRSFTTNSDDSSVELNFTSTMSGCVGADSNMLTRGLGSGLPSGRSGKEGCPGKEMEKKLGVDPSVMYKKTSSDYGSVAAKPQDFPLSFHPKESQFTKHLGKTGMYRNHSLNTGKDISIV